MKSKIVLCVCVLSLATILCGCSKAPSIDFHEGVKETVTDEDSKEDDMEIDIEEEKASEEASRVESEDSKSEEDEVASDEIEAYKEILKAAPAIEGEHDELMDTGFGYEENLEMFGDHLDYFAFCDINQDGVQELIATSIVNFRWAPVYIYTYVDGKTILLEDPLDEDAHGTFEQCSIANGAYDIYICEDNHIHSVWRGNPLGEMMEENVAYVLDGTTLIETDCAVGESENATYFSDIALRNDVENVEALAQ